MNLIVRFRNRVIYLLIVFCFSGCNSQSSRSVSTDSIQFEHIAFNVEDPVAVANWYCVNLNMKIQRQSEPPFNTRFVSDESENMMCEFYHNADVPVPDYFHMNPGSVHIAFEVDNIFSLFEKLKHAGANVVKEPEQMSAGDTICMLRDPWGIPLQLVKRQQAMLH